MNARTVTSKALGSADGPVCVPSGQALLILVLSPAYRCRAWVWFSARRCENIKPSGLPAGFLLWRRRPIHSFAARANSRFGFPGHVVASQLDPFSSACGRDRVGVVTKQKPRRLNSPGFLFWRRPTLARPVAVLPSGLQRFTSVFGMGTGGATALVSPESRSACAARL